MQHISSVNNGTKYQIIVTVETAIPEDSEAGVSIEKGAIIDIGNGYLGIVGKVLAISFPQGSP